MNSVISLTHNLHPYSSLGKLVFSLVSLKDLSVGIMMPVYCMGTGNTPNMECCCEMFSKCWYSQLIVMESIVKKTPVHVCTGEG